MFTGEFPFFVPSVFFFENFVIPQLEIYIKENNKLTPHQFGFHRCISTENAVQSFLNQVYLVFVNSECVSSVFLDLTRTFDLIYKLYLLRNLCLYRIRDFENDVIKCYLVLFLVVHNFFQSK